MLNHIVIMGRLTRDPELRRTATGVAVANFTLAVDRDYNTKDGSEKETDFIDCIAWRGAGEFVSKYFSKGSMAVVSGRLRIRNWTDKDGNKRRSAEVEADSVYFGDRKKTSEGTYTAPTTNAAQGDNGGYPDTMALIDQYQKQGGIPSANDFAMLSGDDGQLPF